MDPRRNRSYTLQDAGEDLGETLWPLAVRAADRRLALRDIKAAVAAMKRPGLRVDGSASVHVIARRVHEAALLISVDREAEKLARIGVAINEDRPWEDLLERTMRDVGAAAKRLFGREGARAVFKAGYAARPSEIRCRVERSGSAEDASLEDRYAIAVGMDWLRRVSSRGLAEVDGGLTLSAVSRPTSEAGLELFEARRATRGRGHAVRTETGFLARDARLGLVAWGADAGAAIRALEDRRGEAGKVVRLHAERLAAPARADGAAPRAGADVIPFGAASERAGSRPTAARNADDRPR